MVPLKATAIALLFAEFNYWCDPDAAAWVFEELGAKIEMVGLDVTREIVFTPTILQLLSTTQPQNGELPR